MNRKIITAAVPALALTALLGACTDQAAGGGGSRDQIKVVGSSTVFPFTTIVAEQFVAKNPGAKAPVIESTGTGAGMKLFCAGVGAAHPDIEDASRRMKASEYATCLKNGVKDIIEVPVGLDGIAFAEAKNGPKLSLTITDLFKAMAANIGGKPNPAKTWADVNPALPAVPIQIYGPPATSGTRDALAELILGRGCEAMEPDSAALKDKKPDDYAKACTRIREDGVYVDAGENDNLIVQKLQSNSNAIGIFGYSYLEENKDKLNGVPINGIEPTYETISQNKYPGSRPLYLYVKKAHLTAIKGLRSFLKEYSVAWDPKGPLVAKGLIASPEDVRKSAVGIVGWETVLDGKTLK
ncbi:PstS family phosphate ABC transporter substrate-binding protein [Sphingomonas immobilis]|uniref:PstS family phosphate ABC transporter substrate-binding protein n=1 Tax=Sphingomonas immobilis TaxID=3063997 RepID=A0ABT8ZTU4_9SPHN|nr:PstS family phosphate ABC transporter substrate-binding protein [Sphingomonas sp. CA1-15]MDO7840985.1 PstS family phosphate ABC transporter substrate-binding protein [Sphingomonas sp. CA1-15]